MTIEKQLKKWLIEMGVWEQDTDAILTLFREHKISEPIREHLNRNADRYPPVMLRILCASLAHVALEWIDDNQPQAWYRECFVEFLPSSSPTQPKSTANAEKPDN